MRGLIVVLWRAGLPIHEALALAEGDLGARRGSLLVRRGKGGRRREVGMDDWAWEQLAPWLAAQVELPVGPLFFVVNGAHAVGMAREGVPLIVIQRQLGHTNLGSTSIHLQGIDDADVIDTVHARRAPMVPTARFASEGRKTGGGKLGPRCRSSSNAKVSAAGLLLLPLAEATMLETGSGYSGRGWSSRLPGLSSGRGQLGLRAR